MVHARAKTFHLLLICTALGVAAGCTPPGAIDEPPIPTPDLGVVTRPPDLGDPFRFDAGVQIEFGPTVKRDPPPPPISGGTLLALKNSELVAASDPDRDRVYVVDGSAKGGVIAELPLNAGDEPGRLVEDAAYRLHVVLRRGGAILDVPQGYGSSSRRAVCPLPRGIDYDAAKDNLWVACAGGELVMLPAAGGAPTVTYHLDRDLRDVVVQNGLVYVSHFRSAEILVLDAANGAAQERIAIPPTKQFDGIDLEAAVAWRMIPWPGVGGGVLVVHQRASSGVVVPMPGGYGGGGMKGCGNGVVATSVTRVAAKSETPATALLSGLTLPVDVVAEPNASSILVVAAGESRLGRSQHAVISPGAATTSNICFGFAGGAAIAGQVTAAARLGSGRVVVQTREPAMIRSLDGVTAITLSNDSREDTGHAVFHTDSGSGIACASCHPEGGEDGRVWNFAKIGPRRTQSVRGGILGTKPFHWDGDQSDLTQLMAEVFTGRMGGPKLTPDRVDALAGFVDKIPALPPVAGDAQAIARGKALYEDAQVGCAACHGGPLLTNNQNADVGTGKAFQVPSLRGLAWRAPYMHDGCAKTLADRFGACGGGDRHGSTSRLSPTQIEDLVKYLETL